MRTFLIGHGLLGSSIATRLRTSPTVAAISSWDLADRAHHELTDQLRRFLAVETDAEWSVVWAAGKGVVHSMEAALAPERHLFSSMLAVLSDVDGLTLERGRLAVISSAGGIYAGTTAPIVRASTPPAPISAYGRHKLTMDEVASEWARRHDCPVLIGRVSTAYGIGQDLGKSQGFISHLCRAVVQRSTFTLSVDADTARDFIDAADVGALFARWLEMPRSHLRRIDPIQIVASGQTTALLDVVNRLRRLSRVPVRLAVRPVHDRREPLATHFSIAGTVSALGAEPRRSIDDGLAAMWRAALDRRASGDPSYR